MKYIPAAIRGRYFDDKTIIQTLEYRIDVCTNTITCVQKDNMLIEFNEKRLNFMDEKTNFRIRRLTPKESWRLMVFSDEDFEKARHAMNTNIYKGKDRSSSQLYKQAGNSIVVDVLSAIMQNLYEAMPYLFEDAQIGSFFSGIGAFEKAFKRVSPDCEKQETEFNLNPSLNQLGYIRCNSVSNRVYDNKLARTLTAEAGGGGAKTGWYKVSILDVKQLNREGIPRVYNKGIAPTLTARDYKDPLRVLLD